MVWPQKNSKGWGRVANQNDSHSQCPDTVRATRADPHRRKRCKDRSSKKFWIEHMILCHPLPMKAKKSGRRNTHPEYRIF